MLILGIETSTEFASISLVKDGKIISEYKFIAYKKLLEELFPSIEMLLRESNFKISDLEGIGVSAGPGSFTGVRIGLITAKTLSQSLSIPLVGFSTLRIISLNFLENNFILSPVIDAKMEEVYTAFFKNNKRISKDMLMEINSYLKKIKKFKSKIIFTGDGLKIYKSLIKKELKMRALFLPESFWYPSSSNIALMAENKIVRGETNSYLEINPVYLKSSQAERRYGRGKKNN